jgi:hypothetical protein
MAATVHRPLRVKAYTADSIWRQYYKLSKQLQDLSTDVVLLSEIHLKPHERFFMINYHFYRTDCFPGRNGTIAIADKEKPCIGSTRGLRLCGGQASD